MPVRNYVPSYTPASPFGLTPVVNSFMAYYIHRSIDPQDDDAEIVMDNQTYVNRPDLLAQDLYGDPDLWWVFGVRNGWKDPVYDLKYGITMHLSSGRYIRGIL